MVIKTKLRSTLEIVLEDGRLIQEGNHIAAIVYNTKGEVERVEGFVSCITRNHLTFINGSKLYFKDIAEIELITYGY